jgi:hypothetical protein
MTPRDFIRMLFTPVMGLLLASCGNSFEGMTPTDETTASVPPVPSVERLVVEWKTDTRGYVATHRAADAGPMAVVECTYVGKQPDNPNLSIKRNWKTEDTDFYHYSISNTSTRPIELERVDLNLREVRRGKVYDSKTASEIETEFGTRVIAPGEIITRSNSWVWGMNNQSRTLDKTYVGKLGDRAIRIPVTLRYRK